MRRLQILAASAFALHIGDASAVAQPAVQPAAVSQTPADPFADLVTEAAQRFGLPAAWINSVIAAESFGDPRAVSPKGAMGLMQLMPQTWAALRVRYRLGADPFDPHDNILAGAAYLRALYDRYGAPGFLAAYNAGPARWEGYLATGRRLPGETRAYLARLAPIIGGRPPRFAAALRSWSEAGLFPAPWGRVPRSARSAPGPSSTLSLDSAQTLDRPSFTPPSRRLFGILSGQESPR